MGADTHAAGAADFSDLDSSKRIPPITPGDVLLYEFMEPLGLSARRLATELHMPPNRITAIIKAERGITAQTALAPGEPFNTSAEFWMNLHSAHVLEVARSERRKVRETAMA